MRIPSTLVAAVAVSALLASCGATGGKDRGSAPGPSDGGPDVPQSAALQTAKHSGEWDLLLEDVRIAEHEHFDRIVLQFAGTGTPGWAVHYVDEAVLDGSGDVVALGGDVILQLDVSGTTWPGPEHDDGPEHLEPEIGGDVVDVHVGGSFEGYSQVFAGIAGGRDPFRVFALADPSRVVVDVHDSAD